MGFLRSGGFADAAKQWSRLILFVVLASLALPVGQAAAHEAAPRPAMDTDMMNSAGWMQLVFLRLEHEATSDIRMLPETPGAIAREWRTFDRDGSSLGALINFAWVALAACLALAAERGAARGLGRSLRRKMRDGPAWPSVSNLALLLLCDVAGLVVFAGVFIWSRHWLARVDDGITAAVLVFGANVLFRWRIAMVVVRVVLRPKAPVARLIAIPDDEAQRLTRFASIAILAIITLIGFGRYGLGDEDSGAPHVVALLIAVISCGLYACVLLRSRRAVEVLIRGRTGGLIGALRAGLARAWLTVGLLLVAGLFIFFVFGLSLGLLSYYHAVVSTLGVGLIVLVLDRLGECGWRRAEYAGDPPSDVDRLLAQGLQRITRSVALLVAAVALIWIWADAIAQTEAAESRVVHGALAAAVTLFVAYVAWELLRLSIDRNLQSAPSGPKMPGADADEESAPGSRLQTVLPLMRVMLGAIIAVVALLVVLSRLGIDTAPLIAGASVFGLAISFGSQSLVRDVISGLFYMWDDAFRIGEYIDTGRLKGTVEALGIRSVKVRHHNGPLHTIPYGQLGAVTNMSRDFATIKFNLRLEPGTDIELVRKTAKKIGIEMQDDPEIAAEVMLPLKMQGIAEVVDGAVVVRFKFTARPIKPSWLQREYLKRIYRVFAEQGIQFASGALTLQTVGAVPQEAPQRSPALVALAGRQFDEAAVAIGRPVAQTQPA